MAPSPAGSTGRRRPRDPWACPRCHVRLPHTSAGERGGRPLSTPSSAPQLGSATGTAPQGEATTALLASAGPPPPSHDLHGGALVQPGGNPPRTPDVRAGRGGPARCRTPRGCWASLARLLHGVCCSRNETVKSPCLVLCLGPHLETVSVHMQFRAR